MNHALAQVRQYEPTWESRTSLTTSEPTIRREIARIEAIRDEARALLRRVGPGGNLPPYQLDPTPPGAAYPRLRPAGQLPDLPGGARIVVPNTIHGPVVEGLQDRWREALDWMLRAGTGDIRGVLSHPDVPGRIDLIWGTEKGGLLHIARHHPEILRDLPERLSRMRKVFENNDYILLETPDSSETAVISKQFNFDPKSWLLTAYDRRIPRRP
jgi:hypothetical protein